MDVRFGSSARGHRWAWTNGAAAESGREIAVPLAWPEHDPRDQAAVSLLAFVAAHIPAQPITGDSSATVPYGWTTLRLRAARDDDALPLPAALVLEELEDPLRRHATAFVPGAAWAIRLHTIQRGTLARHGFTGDGEHPHRSSIASYCARITPAALLYCHFVIERSSPPGTETSGWAVRCTEPDHPHGDPTQWRDRPLLDLVAACPRAFPYLAMPQGSAVGFLEDKVVVFRPGEGHGYLDDTPPFDGVLAL